MAINACYVIEFFSALHERKIIKSTLKTIKERGDTFCSYYTHTNVKGIACSLNGLPKSIRFSIEDGLIISAKEFWKL